MLESIRIVAVLSLWLALALGLASACGCATVRKAAPYAARAGVCCAKCVADEWRSYRAAPAEHAPSSSSAGGAP